MSDIITKDSVARMRRQRRRRLRVGDDEDILSVSQFVARIVELRGTGMPTAFRGQTNYTWKGVPTLFRPDERLVSREHEMVRDLISIHPQEFHQDATMFDRLVRMQHYGLPTRLLDVTLNPLVALYFAAQDFWTEEPLPNGATLKKPIDGRVMAYYVTRSKNKYYDSDTVACLANLANLNHDTKKKIEAIDVYEELNAFNSSPGIKELVRYVSHEKPNFAATINPRSLYRPVFVRPKNSNRRIIAQAGAFIIYGLENKEFIFGSKIEQISIRIRAENKGDIREELSILGIDASTLFPELEKAAEIIKYKHKKKMNTLDMYNSAF